MVSAARVRRRSGEAGQALLLALVTLLIASIAAGLVALDLTWRERALQEEAAHVHLRAQLDGAMAEAAARLANHFPVEAEEHAWPGGGTSTTDAVEISTDHWRVRVRATYAGRSGAAEASVDTIGGAVIHDWHRVTAAAAP